MAAALAFAAVSASGAENRSSPGLALSRRLPGSHGVVALNAQLAGDSAEDVKPSVTVPVAVIDFDYQDTSGEPRNQSAEHHALMAEFMNKLRNDLAGGIGVGLAAEHRSRARAYRRLDETVSIGALTT